MVNARVVGRAHHTRSIHVHRNLQHLQTTPIDKNGEPHLPSTPPTSRNSNMYLYIYLPRRHTWDFTMLKGTWPILHNKPDRLYESSTIAEPKAVEEIIALKPFPSHIRHVLFVTDHSPLVSASRSQQARCYAYFNVLNKLEKERFTYNLLFIKGELNIADGPSRGIDRVVTRREHEALAAGAGMGYAAALLSPSIHVPTVVGYV